MTFTLDHPYGYKLAGYPEGEARIVAKDGRRVGAPLIVEYRSAPKGMWWVMQCLANGESIVDSRCNLINAPAPKRKVYMAMMRKGPNEWMEPWWSGKRETLEQHPNRISPVVEVEIDV